MKTIDDVIEQCEEIANASKQHTLHMTHFSQSYDEWAEEWTQIADWLKELKAYKENTCGDAISRQAVLDAIMANNIWENEYNLTSSRIKKAVESLPSVTPQSCEDAISRQAVLDCQHFIYDETGEELEVILAENVLNLPSVTPQQRTGRWIDSHIPESTLCECSACGFTCGAYSFNYCPNCGCSMKGELE